MAIKPGPTDPGRYSDARERAGARHNKVLVRHGATPYSFGAGILMLCACGVRGDLAGYGRHLYEVCLDVPVAR